MSVLIRVIGLCGLLCLSTHNLANSIQDHAFPDVNHPKLSVMQNRFPGYLADGEFDRLLTEATELKTWIIESEMTRIQKAKALNNLSIYIARSGDLNEALLAIGAAVENLESITPFHPDLYHVMMTKAYMLVYEEAFEDAEDSLRHAQHIAHRNQGVYAKDQLPTLRLLTDIQLSSGKKQDADQNQRFLLRVNEQIYGASSEEMIPSLTEVGEYFANRGWQMRARYFRTPNDHIGGRNRVIEFGEPAEDTAYLIRIFREAELAYERSIAIIQDKYGDTDLRLVEPLKGLSRAKFLEGGARSAIKRPMEQMVAIVQQNPGSDQADKAKALVELADLYVKTSDPRASDYYKQAWKLLEGEEYQELRYELFGRPVRLLPEHSFRSVLTRYPVDLEPDQQLFVNLTYDVQEDGKVGQVIVNDSNISLKNQKDTRKTIKAMKFRPRLVDGEPVATEGLNLLQTFTVEKPEPVFESTVRIAP